MPVTVQTKILDLITSYTNKCILTGWTEPSGIANLNDAPITSSLIDDSQNMFLLCYAYIKTFF